jgi:predicted aspartyl protease
MVVFVTAKFTPLSAAEPPTAIPFKLYDGFAIVVRGGIGNQNDLNMLIDTGAVPSVIQHRLALKLGLQGPREDVSVVGQTLSMERVMIPTIRLGTQDFPPVSVVVLDLMPVEKRLGVRLDAIVGLDVLSRRNLSIDYQLKRIEIGTSANNGRAVPFELLTATDAPYVVVQIQTNDSRVVRLLLDTGADGITLFASGLGEVSLYSQKSAALKEVSAAGAYTAQQVQLRDVQLGGFHRSNRLATLLQSPASAQPFDGMLGPTSLGITRMDFDFRSRILYLRMER